MEDEDSYGDAGVTALVYDRTPLLLWEHIYINDLFHFDTSSG